MEAIVVDTIISGSISNLLTIGVAAVFYIIYQRCHSCNSRCHTAWFDCEAPEMKQKKENSKIDVLLKALEIHRRRTEHSPITDKDENRRRTEI